VRPTREVGIAPGTAGGRRRGARQGASDGDDLAPVGERSLGGLEQASSIYHELSRSPQATERLYRLWLSNCERRQHWVEAAAVCCELGDVSLAAAKRLGMVRAGVVDAEVTVVAAPAAKKS